MVYLCFSPKPKCKTELSKFLKLFSRKAIVIETSTCCIWRATVNDALLCHLQNITRTQYAGTGTSSAVSQKV